MINVEERLIECIRLNASIANESKEQIIEMISLGDKAGFASLVMQAFGIDFPM